SQGARPSAPSPAARPSAPAAGKPAEPPRKQTMDLEAPSRPPASKPSPAAPAAAAATAGLAERLSGMGLTKEQVEGVLKLTHEVIEQVVWEVVPDLAETLITEEIRRLTRE
ncbi:MAG: response regulator, partial [Myxococcota bacterium]